MEERRSKERVMSIEVYTDGSLKKIGKETFGGWGFIVVKDGHKIYETGGNQPQTTNQRMELQAMKEALAYASSIRRPSERIVIYSDSAYIINCYQQDWYINWQNNGWRTANKTPVANQDLWAEIVPYFDNFWYSFKKVEGHSGNYWNEECDAIAQQEAEVLKKSWRGKPNG